MRSRPAASDPEQVRGERILREMERLERRKKSPRVTGCLPWVLLALLVLAIVVVASIHQERLAGYWLRLVRPDSILGR